MLNDFIIESSFILIYILDHNIIVIILANVYITKYNFIYKKFGKKYIKILKLNHNT